MNHTDPLMPPDVDPGPFDDEHAAQWNRWADGLLVLLGAWILFLGIGAGAILAWAWHSGLLGT